VRVIAPPARAFRPSDDARAALRRRLGIAPEEIAIAAAGPAGRRSGHKLSVWATAILSEAGFPVRLLLEQTNQASRDVANFGREAGFADQVILTQPDVALPELLAAADLAVLMGLDSFPPATAAAAMAGGLAIVAGDSPAAADWFTHGQNALLVRPDSPRAISRGLMRLIEEPATAGRLGEAARSAAAAFDPDGVGRLWRALYGELSGARGPAGPQRAVEGPRRSGL